jgi:hypothetical protein
MYSELTLIFILFGLERISPPPSLRSKLFRATPDFSPEIEIATETNGGKEGWGCQGLGDVEEVVFFT